MPIFYQEERGAFAPLSLALASDKPCSFEKVSIKGNGPLTGKPCNLGRALRQSQTIQARSSLRQQRWEPFDSRTDQGKRIVAHVEPHGLEKICGKLMGPTRRLTGPHDCSSFY
jgi:hypothetical protein